MGMGPGMATKVTWLPPGTWVDANTGVVTTVAESDTAHMHTSSYAINEVPLWYAAGSVIPYVPLRSQASSVGNAARQYTFLGFKVCCCLSLWGAGVEMCILPSTKLTIMFLFCFVFPCQIIPGGSSGSTSVYEDDGKTTAYLTNNAYAWTTATYTSSGNSLTVTISTTGSYPGGYPPCGLGWGRWESQSCGVAICAASPAVAWGLRQPLQWCPVPSVGGRARGSCPWLRWLCRLTMIMHCLSMCNLCVALWS